MPPLTLDVDGRDVVFTEPPKARAAARRWSRMARDLDAADAPAEAKTKVRELRARAKAANDWARSEEDRAPTHPREESATAGESGEADQPAGPSPARRRAAAALRDTGIRRKGKSGARAASKAAKATSGTAVDVTSWGEFAIFFASSLIGLVLLDDLLSAKGSAGFAGATKTATGIVQRIIEPVPIVKAN